MNTTLDERLMSAQNPTDPAQTTGTPRGEVKPVALFEIRKERVTRAWDELSEIDRQVLLESARQRRKNQALKTKIYSEIYGIRANR